MRVASIGMMRMRLEFTTPRLDPGGRGTALALLGLFLLFTFSLAVLAEGAAREPWVAPARYVRKKNRVPADQASIDRGRQLYLKNCLSCHGLQGRGDGPAASGLDVHPGNLTDAKRMAAQSDGELYFKIRTGRRPMPTFRKTLKSKEIWDVVNYVRTLAGATATASPARSWFQGKPPALAEQMHAILGQRLLAVLERYAALREAVRLAEGGSLASASAGLLKEMSDLAVMGGPAQFQKETRSLAKLLSETLKGIGADAGRKTRFEACSTASSALAQFLSRYRLKLPESWTYYLYQSKGSAGPLYWIQRGSSPKNPYSAGGKAGGSVIAVATFGKPAAASDG